MKKKHVARVVAAITAVGLAESTSMTVLAEAAGTVVGEGTENLGNGLETEGEKKPAEKSHVTVRGTGEESWDGNVVSHDLERAVTLKDHREYNEGDDPIEEKLDGKVTITGNVSLDDSEITEEQKES